MMNTSELTSQQLDWAVAKCEGYVLDCDEGADISGLTVLQWRYEPSTNWSQGGPIIERKGIGLWRSQEGLWFALYQGIPYQQIGPTPLIAAMRCYVASKLGDKVDIPDQLT